MTASRRALAVALPALLFLTLAEVDAATLRVPADYATIPEAAEAALSGDRILVAPGVHLLQTTIRIDRKSVELISEQGPEQTTLVDVTPEFPRQAMVIAQGRPGHTLVLRGFSFDGRVPGAKERTESIVDARELDSFLMEDCRVRGFGRVATALGGLVDSREIGSAVLSRCTFEDCIVSRSAVEIAPDFPDGGDVHIRDCEFSRNHVFGMQPLISLGNNMTLVCQDTRILRNDTEFGVFRLIGNNSLRLDRCLIARNGARAATGRSQQGSGSLATGAAQGSVEIRSSTIVANRTARGALLTGDLTATIDNSIVWKNTVGVSVRPSMAVTAQFTCTDEAWDFTAPGMLRVEPRFCGWSAPLDVWVDSNAELDGDGSRRLPHRRLRDALGEFDFSLQSDSICATAGPEGSALGFLSALCDARVAQPLLRVHLAAGDYQARLQQELCLGVELLGSGRGETRLLGGIGSLGTDSLLRDVSVEPDNEGLPVAGVEVCGDRVRLERVEISGPFDFGIYSEGADLDLDDVRIEGAATNGVVLERGSLSMRLGSVSRCGATGILLARTSGSTVRRALRLEDCVLERNRGGGVIFEQARGEVRVERCRFLGNTSVLAGAALHLASDSPLDVDIRDCEFGENTSEAEGGAVSLAETLEALEESSMARIEDSTFYLNSARASGSAISCANGDLVVDHCTVAYHDVGKGAIATGVDARLILSNSILWSGGPIAGLDPWSADGAPPRVLYSCISSPQVPPGLGNINRPPRWCPWDGRAEIWVSSAAETPGDGTRARPFASLGAAFATRFTLSADSPCLGAGSAGTLMGAPAEESLSVCADSVLIHLVEGDYPIRGVTLDGGMSLVGSDPAQTVLEGSLRVTRAPIEVRQCTLRSTDSRPALAALAHARVDLEDALVEYAGSAIRLQASAHVEVRDAVLRRDSLDLSLENAELHAIGGVLQLIRCDLQHVRGGTTLLAEGGAEIELDACRLVLSGVSTDDFIALVDSQLRARNCILQAIDIRDGALLRATNSNAEFLHCSAHSGILGGQQTHQQASPDSRIEWIHSALSLGGHRDLAPLDQLSDGRIQFEHSLANTTVEHALAAWPGLRRGDALFTEDLRLSVGSPAIDAALGERTLALDIDGRPRPCHDAPDLGAHEFCGSLEATGFRRGDVDQDERLTLSDGIGIVDWLFRQGPRPSCSLAADVNSDDRIDVSDPIALFDYLFLRGRAPEAPWPDCGTDPEEPIGSCDPERACER